MSGALAVHCLIFCHVYLAVFVPRLHRISWETQGAGWISNWSSEERGDLWVTWMCWRDKMETRIIISVGLEGFYYVWQGSKYTAVSSTSILRFIHELRSKISHWKCSSFAGTVPRSAEVLFTAKEIKTPGLRNQVSLQYPKELSYIIKPLLSFAQMARFLIVSTSVLLFVRSCLCLWIHFSWFFPL